MVSRQLLSFLRQAHCFLSWEWRNNWHFLQTQDVTLITFLPDSDSILSQSGNWLFKSIHLYILKVYNQKTTEIKSVCMISGQMVKL